MSKADRGGRDDPDLSWDKFPCPCCGFLTFEWLGATHEVCPVCCWEDDASGPYERSAANGQNSLLEARQSFMRRGAGDERWKPFVREPLPEELA
jgi:hypothetical protein